MCWPACWRCVFVAAPIMGCSLFNKEEDYVPEDPADKLYNEGLFLLNNKQDYDGRGEEIRSKWTGKIRIPIGRARRC